MTITTRDQLITALANNSSRILIEKAAPTASMAAALLYSYWRSTGAPGQGAIPTSAAVPTTSTAGAIDFTQQTSPATSYLAWLGTTVNVNSSIEIHDRIAHLGGLVLNVTTSQTVTGLDLSTLAPSAGRLGATNYSNGQWYLEVYADGGATASNATINVTYNDASTGNLTAVAVGGVLRIGRMISLTPLIPSADQGKFIRGINSVILSASTGAAGNFGFTYLRQRAIVFGLSNFSTVSDWAQLGLPEIANGACLQLLASPSSATSASIRGQGKIAHG